MTRTFAHRHGLGPLPTEDPNLVNQDPLNKYNEWQRDFRLGHLDLPLLRYSVKESSCIQGLVITHLDQVPEKKLYCSRYDGLGNRSIRDLACCFDPKPVMETFDSVPELLASELGLPVMARSSGENDNWVMDL